MKSLTNILHKKATLSQIAISASQVMFASALIEPMINGNYKAGTVIAGAAMTMFFWYGGLLLADK